MGVTERTFYPAILEVIREKGGSGVQEIQYDSVPDIVFDFLGYSWILSVKIGESISAMKDAFVQYLRHKAESGLQNGILLMLPDSARKVPPTESEVRHTIRTSKVFVIVDASGYQAAYRDRTFGEVLDTICVEVVPRIKQGIARHYPLQLVLSFLKQQLLDVMNGLVLSEDTILRIVTDKKLLSDLGGLGKQEVTDVGKFLAAYIMLSQILFLRLFAVSHPTVVTGTGPMTRTRLRSAFNKILEINYRPIYELDVLDAVPDDYLRDTFDLIWGLEVENVRYELPGRIFHALMPPHIRKMLAAFYTRPQAAEILARLAIEDDTSSVFDPACGSGTILVAAYRVKQEIHHRRARAGSPHQQFCEQDLFGADIMPFAVHLTCANLAAMDVGQKIERTQIILGDSLDLVAGKVYPSSLQLALFRPLRKAKMISGEEYEVKLDEVDVVLMNPPFTKVERGIRNYVNMERFKEAAGGEVGLWGHFVFLADQFLRDGGIFGAVLPINVLRGRESERVRSLLFKKWTPLYVLKPTYNYGFSEWAEYRDILVIARKEAPAPTHKVKFCLVKENLNALDEAHIRALVEEVKGKETLRSDWLDIDSHPLTELEPRFRNLMWFCGVSDLRHRDVFVRLHSLAAEKLAKVPDGYLREGYRPVPKGVSDFLFITRATPQCRTEQAFLQFTSDDSSVIQARTPFGTEYPIERESLTLSLRTPVGLRSMDITKTLDYIAHRPYTKFSDVKSASGFTGKLRPRFWDHLQSELARVQTHAVTVNRINPYSPHTHLVAFVADVPFAPSNQLNVVREADPKRARAFVLLANSWPFFCQFFLLKEESTGRYMHLRFYDLYEMNLYPSDNVIDPLNRVFEEYAAVPFPSLREQFDMNFDERYREYQEARAKRAAQMRLWMILKEPIKPCPERVSLDMEVARVLGVKIAERDLHDLYDTIVKEMIIARGLARD